VDETLGRGPGIGEDPLEVPDDEIAGEARTRAIQQTTSAVGWHSVG
jgi:hypothetical protein